MLRATAINNGATRSDRPNLVTTLAGVPGPVVTLGDSPTDITTIVVSTLSLADCTVDVDSTPFIPSPEGVFYAVQLAAFRRNDDRDEPG